MFAFPRRLEASAICQRLTFESPPLMSSRHRNQKPLERWHATIYKDNAQILYSWCHTKRRIGRALPANPSVDMTTTRIFSCIFAEHTLVIFTHFSDSCLSLQLLNMTLIFLRHLPPAFHKLKLYCKKATEIL